MPIAPAACAPLRSTWLPLVPLVPNVQTSPTALVSDPGVAGVSVEPSGLVDWASAIAPAIASIVAARTPGSFRMG